MSAHCGAAPPDAPHRRNSFEHDLQGALACMDGLVEAHRGEKRHVLVAALPKSASTWFGRVLVEATGFRSYWLNPLGHDTERDILRTAIPLLLAFDTVTTEHVRASRSNVEWMRRLGLRPIVLVRDIFDIVVSMRDHSIREQGKGPAGRTPAGFETWTPREQLWYCVRAGAPWVIGLHASWVEAANVLPIEWIRYDDLVREPVATVERALRHAGVPVSEERVERAIAAVDPVSARFNRGRSGRGREELDAEQIAAIENAASAYGAYDLSRIGLGEPKTEQFPRPRVVSHAGRRQRDFVTRHVRLPDDLDDEDARRVDAWRSVDIDETIIAAATTFRRLDRVIARRRPARRSVFVATFPTVSRAQIRCAIARTAGLRAVRLAPIERDLEENLLAERLVMFCERDCVACHVTRATVSNVARLKAAGVKPIVVVRDLLETIEALPRWLGRTKRGGSIGPSPAGEVSRIASIRLFMPWLLDFVASWQEAASELDVLWVNDAEFREDPERVVLRVLDHSGIAARATWPVRACAAPRRSRMDAAQSSLAQAECDEVRAIASAWRGSFDFSVVGL